MDTWNNDTPILKIPGLIDKHPQVDPPIWIDQDISPCDVESINQGGCASGAYMPAVTYHRALETMAEHGDDVLQYIEDSLGEVPQPGEDHQSWAGMACFYLSTAVEIWASQAADTLNDFDQGE